VEVVMLRYVGDGTEVPGVPPRDLTAAEAAIFGAVIGEVDAARAAAGCGPLYVVDGVDEEPDGHGLTPTGTDGQRAETDRPGAGATEAAGRRRGRRGDG